MKKIWLWMTVILLSLAPPALAETVYLNTGEIIRGHITQVDDNTISIESEKGFGIIQIKRSDISLVEFDENERDPSRLIGIGYVHHPLPSGIGSEAAQYAADAVSLKVWLSKVDSVDFLVGFYSASQDSNEVFKIFSLDLRYARVFSRRGNLDLYGGASVGYVNVVDKTAGQDISDTGSQYSLFLGSEVFFDTLPNLGFSAEIGLGAQNVAGRNTTSLSTTTFPTFSLRYYF
jgi:hypothetical protein